MSYIKVLPFCFSIFIVTTCASRQAIEPRQAETPTSSSTAVVAPLLSSENRKADEDSPPTPVCRLFLTKNVIDRAALTQIIDAGLGSWLVNVEGDRSIIKGKFQGWVIKRLPPNDPCYQQTPVLPGDVVLRINSKSIEKPEQAFDVFESLRLATELRIEYSRQGKTQLTRFDIAK